MVTTFCTHSCALADANKICSRVSVVVVLSQETFPLFLGTKGTVAMVFNDRWFQ